ncbi:MAG: ATP-binding protein [Thermodesulfobacteriota bacterium]|nr:ATP-binding protein [Thermodesulfobacteriota bacterium]
MKRNAEQYLKSWRQEITHKPLVIRGARQVGKTYLVRSFAREFGNLVEINFERNPEIAELFISNDPVQIIGLLELQLQTTITPGNTLLFLDEIQARPDVIASLRYFYEEMGDLHIIAAGSLLEFALEKPTFSMPVGRIEYLYLGPMQFEEYLVATGREKLVLFLQNFQFSNSIPAPIHKQLLEHLQVFIITGGMPDAIKNFIDTNSWQQCEKVKASILTTFRDDFNKYGVKANPDVLYDLFRKIPFQVGRKFKYVNINRHLRAAVVSKALNLLCQAKVANIIHHSSGNGLPLGAEINHKKFKIIFLDSGLMATACGLNFLDISKVEDIILVNNGKLCEQFIGQHLLYAGEFYREPELFYWAREQRGSSAEVDYLISNGTNIIPVEVKAGKGSSLKSLQMFLKTKQLKTGLRFNSDTPSLLKTKTVIANGNNIPFQLLSLPLYMVGQAKRLLADLD